MVRAQLLVSFLHLVALPAVDGGRHVAPAGRVAKGGEGLLPDDPEPTGELSREGFPSDPMDSATKVMADGGKEDEEEDIGLSPKETASLVSDTGSSTTRTGRRRHSHVRVDLDPSNVDRWTYFGTGTIPYIRIQKACVTGMNLDSSPRAHRGHITHAFEQCVERCNNRPDCRSIEFGRNYIGGAAGAFEEGECRMQEGIDAHDCDGESYNTDLYIKSVFLPDPWYTHYPGACVSGHNIEMIHDSDLSQCQTRCNAHPDCMAFEFGVDWGGSGYGEANDCHLQSGSSTSDCDGQEYNFDLYIKEGRPSAYHVEGSWEYITVVSEDGYTAGVVGTTSSSTSTEVSTEVRMAMSQGVEAGFVTSEVSVEIGIAASISRGQSYTNAVSTSQTIKRSTVNGASQLWQWVYKPQEMPSITTRSDHFALTRVGAEPRCLPGFFAPLVAIPPGELVCPATNPSECSSGQFHAGQECTNAAAEYRSR